MTEDHVTLHLRSDGGTHHALESAILHLADSLRHGNHIVNVEQDPENEGTYRVVVQSSESETEPTSRRPVPSDMETRLFGQSEDLR